MRRGVPYISALLCGMIGFGLTVFWYETRDKPNQSVVCRPSAPHLLPAGQKVLFWGNSLAFDHAWRLPDRIAVNCARQGLTAKAALPILGSLPKADFSAVVIVFGTVELMRNSTILKDFQDAMNANLIEIRKSYPDAKYVVMGVPAGKATIWDYGNHLHLDELNVFLGDLPDTIFLDTTSVLSHSPENGLTYDGVHLTSGSYAAIEAELNILLQDRTK